MSTTPLITVIVASFNGEKTFARCIESILNQSYSNKELIIMDGGSTDGSVDILKRYDDQIKYWESKPDRGIYHAWNKALEHAEGEWLCFIGCDDFFYDENVLSSILPDLLKAESSGHNYLYGKIAYCSNKSNKIYDYENDPISICRFRKGRPLFHAGSFHSKRMFRTSKFNEKYRIAGDFDLLLRELKENDACYVDRVIICMGMGGVSYDLSYRRKMIQESFLAWKSNQMETIPWYLYISYFKIIVFLFIQKIIGMNASLKLADRIRKIRGLKPRWNI